MTKVLMLSCLIALTYQSDAPEVIKARFVAFDNLQGLSNPREPIQRLMVEIQDPSLTRPRRLAKVVYFAPSRSTRGSASFLNIDTLNYKNLWTLSVHTARETREHSACNDFDNFWRASDGSIDENEKHEPILRYRSTQFAGEVKFEKLSEIPCMILESIS